MIATVFSECQAFLKAQQQEVTLRYERINQKAEESGSDDEMMPDYDGDTESEDEDQTQGSPRKTGTP